MVTQTILDVAICTGILVAFVAFAVLGHLALVGRDVRR